MSFRRKLLAVFALTVIFSVAGVALLVQWVTRNAFEKAESLRAAALVTQFQREFGRRGDDVAKRVDAIAASDPVTRMANALNGTSSDFAEYFDLARIMAESRQLDFVEILDARERSFPRRNGRRSSGIPSRHLKASRLLARMHF